LCTFSPFALKKGEIFEVHHKIYGVSPSFLPHFDHFFPFLGLKTNIMVRIKKVARLIQNTAYDLQM